MKSSRPSSLAAFLAASAAFAGLGGIAGAAMSPTLLQEQIKVGMTANQGIRTQGTQAAAGPSRTGERNAIAKALFGGSSRYRPGRYPNGPGWSPRQVQRMARKRRNKIRNRKAHR